MRSPTLAELPSPPPGRSGWPWTAQSPVVDPAESTVAWPRVSVITPSLDQAAYLEETIRSVLLQGYPDLEYIVMDGGSRDGSVEIIRRYEPWLAHWVSEPDAGQTAAINLGWSRATGALLAYLNSDDAYLPGAVALAARAWRRSPDAGMIYGDARVIDATSRELRVWRARPFSVRAMLVSGNVVPQSASFYARSALDQVGFLDERWRMIMDYELSLRVGLRLPAVCVAEPIATFRDHPESRSRRLMPLMAREVTQLVGELDDSPVAREPDWASIRQTARSRVEYEWAMWCLIDGGDHGIETARHLRRSLRLDPAFALRRPIQTSYVLKEIARRRWRARRARP